MAEKAIEKIAAESSATYAAVENKRTEAGGGETSLSHAAAKEVPAEADNCETLWTSNAAGLSTDPTNALENSATDSSEPAVDKRAEKTFPSIPPGRDVDQPTSSTNHASGEPNKNPAR